MKREILSIVLETLKKIPELKSCDFSRVTVDATKHKSHGDYATNASMVLAHQIKKNPRELAKKILESFSSSNFFSKIEIAGPGFINFHLEIDKVNWLLDEMDESVNLGCKIYDNAQTIVVDMSSPNLAKEMHVGHLRSTIIGDSVARVLEYLGHNVIRQNHVGDWGTQFGMLLAQMELMEANGEAISLKDLEAFYVSSKKNFDNDEEFAKRSRDLVVKLQSGDEETIKKWENFRGISLDHCNATYKNLGVKLTPADVKGESFYNPMLAGIIDTLRDKELLSESDGAQCVFLDGYKNIDGEPLPMIIQKAGGGYLYSTTDLAAIQHRANDLNANRVLYFVDNRQSQHFEMVFKIAKQAGLLSNDCSLEHMGFGTMNGKDGRPFKSRDGGTVKLAELLDEAFERAFVLVKSKNPNIDEADALAIAKTVGVSSVKYADLSKHRSGDYVFDYDQMLSFEGNTAPYLLYAYTRCTGIFRKLNMRMHCYNAPSLVKEQEIDLGKKILGMKDILIDVAEQGTPHLLCNYLYEVASLFSAFYENCPVLADHVDIITQERRIALVALTGKVLREGLSLLGIEAIEKM